MISIFAVWPNDTGEKIYTMLGAAASEGCDGRDAGKARRAQGFTPDIKATAFKSHALVSTLVPRSPQRVVNQAGRRLLPLDGNAQGGDGQFRSHVIAHCPANNFAGEKIEHGGQIEPPIGGWHAGDGGQAKSDWAVRRKIAVEPVGGKMDTSDISDVLKWANRDGCPWGGPGTAAALLPSCLGGA
jgi:hypothetical protein